MKERWELLNQDVTLYSPEVSRIATPDEFLETEDSQHTIIRFQNVFVGIKRFESVNERDEWVSRHPMGKRVEVINRESQVKKAGNIIEIRNGTPPDDLFAAIMIYIERVLPPEDVSDWVI